MADGAETLLDSYYPQATQTGFFSDTNISMRRTITTDTGVCIWVSEIEGS